MKRGYTVLEYKSIIRRLKAIRPDLLVSSDFIVGFPGETDADFDAMMKLIDDIDFDNSFSFLYSPRPERLPPPCRSTFRWMSAKTACNASRPGSRNRRASTTWQWSGKPNVS